MIKTITASTLLFLALLSSSCVSRTVSSEPALSDLQKGIGYNYSDRIV